MNTITILVTIGEDRKLVVDLPADFPTGEAEVTIKLLKTREVSTPINPKLEALRAKLLAAGALSTSMDLPDGTRTLTDEELANYVQLPPDARPSEDLIDEDRGEY